MTHVIERAYQLAAGGAFAHRSQISRALEKEGYSQLDLQHLVGASITRDLNRVCREAAAPKAA